MYCLSNEVLICRGGVLNKVSLLSLPNPKHTHHPYYWRLILNRFQILFFLWCWLPLCSRNFFDVFSHPWFCQQDWGQASGIENCGPYGCASNLVTLHNVLHWFTCLAGTLNTITLKTGSIPLSPAAVCRSGVNLRGVKHSVRLKLGPILLTAITETQFIFHRIVLMAVTGHFKCLVPSNR